MKAGIHPRYSKTTVTCVCGNTFETRTTVGDKITVEICSNCHPFFTGKQKLVDTAGRVERFMKKYGIEEKETTGKAEEEESSQEGAAGESLKPEAKGEESAADQ